MRLSFADDRNGSIVGGKGGKRTLWKVRLDSGPDLFLRRFLGWALASVAGDRAKSECQIYRDAFAVLRSQRVNDDLVLMLTRLRQFICCLHPH